MGAAHVATRRRQTMVVACLLVAASACAACCSAALRFVGVVLYLVAYSHASRCADADVLPVVSAQLLLDVFELTEFSPVPVTEKFSLPRLNIIWKQLMSMVYRGTQAKALVIAAMQTVCSNIMSRYLVSTEQPRVGGSLWFTIECGSCRTVVMLP